MNISFHPQSLLRLLQLSSGVLPVGSYSYSEGLETLVEQGMIVNCNDFQQWLNQAVSYGSIRIEAAILTRAYHAVMGNNSAKLIYWNRWLSATRETEELRRQSWQMGRSLLCLILALEPEIKTWMSGLEKEVNFAVVFAVATAYWQIELNAAVSGYLYSWVNNLVTVGVKLIPLGQTEGQKLLSHLFPVVEKNVQEIINLPDEDLRCCSWGLSLASMTHETLYTRLFRS